MDLRSKISQNARNMSKIHKALANERRVWILEILFKWENKELSVGIIADKLGLSLKSTSKHLIQLEEACIIQHRQENTSILYSISINDVQLRSYLKNKLEK